MASDSPRLEKQTSDSTPNPVSSTNAGRGEPFDPSWAPPVEGQTEATSGSKSRIAAWLLVGVLAAYCLYTLGAIVGERSKKPAPLGPFTASSAQPAPLKVHVAGRVKKPGVYTLPFNSRVQDALKRAGGPLPGADLGALNLADWAQDGSKIEVPNKSAPLPTPTPTVIVREVRVPVPIPATRDIRSSTKPQLGEGAPANEGASTGEDVPRAVTESGGQSSNASPDFLQKNPLDLNTATAQQLETLPGVGPKMAERILAFRAENGPFKAIDDLDEVKGIGEKRMEELRPLVRVK